MQAEIKEDLQKSFAKLCKTGETPLSSAIPKEKAIVYHELISHSFESALKCNYPLAYSLLKKEEWKELVSAFLASYECCTPYFWQMPKGLVHFAKQHKWDEKLQIPYFCDLLEFEWIEIELYMMEDREVVSFVETGDVLQDPLYVNPEHAILQLSYPVYTKIPLEKTTRKGSYPLFCFRHPETKQVHFIAITPFYQALIQLISDQGLIAKEAITVAAEHFHIPQNDKLLTICKNFLMDLLFQKALYGWKKKENTYESVL